MTRHAVHCVKVNPTLQKAFLVYSLPCCHQLQLSDSDKLQE